MRYCLAYQCPLNNFGVVSTHPRRISNLRLVSLAFLSPTLHQGGRRYGLADKAKLKPKNFAQDIDSARLSRHDDLSFMTRKKHDQLLRPIPVQEIQNVIEKEAGRIGWLDLDKGLNDPY